MYSSPFTQFSPCSEALNSKQLYSNWRGNILKRMSSRSPTALGTNKYKEYVIRQTKKGITHKRKITLSRKNPAGLICSILYQT